MRKLCKLLISGPDRVLARHNGGTVRQCGSQSRPQVWSMCAALSRHQQEGDATLVQHATMREPPQGRGLRSSPTHAGSRM